MQVTENSSANSKARKIVRSLYFRNKINLQEYMILNQVISTAEIQKYEVAYLCKGHNDANKYCKHTTDISFAKNFEKVDENKYMEIERGADDGEHQT